MQVLVVPRYQPPTRESIQELYDWDGGAGLGTESKLDLSARNPADYTLDIPVNEKPIGPLRVAQVAETQPSR
jgi:hypothetical protein